MSRNHGPQIKDDDQYEALRKKGMSKEKSARIANSNKHETGQKGGKSHSYDEWTKKDLLQKAKEVGVEGRSKMSKNELIKELRH